jgi:hypothetical protein
MSKASVVGREGSFYIGLTLPGYRFKLLSSGGVDLMAPMSRLTPIYPIYGFLYTTFSLGIRHTAQVDQPARAPWLDRPSLIDQLNGRLFGSTTAIFQRRGVILCTTVQP